MAGYILAQLRVTDPKLYARYRDALVPLVDRLGGRWRIDDGEVEVLAGNPTTRRVLLLEFPSCAAARLFFESPEHEPIEALRGQATEGELWLLEST